MSYVVSTGAVEFYRGRQNYGGGVPVAVCSVPTVLATEDSYLQGKPLLGSRSTACAGHGCVRGRNQHHPSPRPRGTFDQLSFRGTDRSIRRFPRHGGLGEELRFEVLHSDTVMNGHDLFRPSTGVLLALPPDIPLLPSCLPRGLPVLL